MVQMQARERTRSVDCMPVQVRGQGMAQRWVQISVRAHLQYEMVIPGCVPVLVYGLR